MEQLTHSPARSGVKAIVFVDERVETQGIREDLTLHISTRSISTLVDLPPCPSTANSSRLSSGSPGGQCRSPAPPCGTQLGHGRASPRDEDPLALFGTCDELGPAEPGRMHVDDFPAHERSLAKRNELIESGGNTCIVQALGTRWTGSSFRPRSIRGWEH